MNFLTQLDFFLRKKRFFINLGILFLAMLIFAACQTRYVVWDEQIWRYQKERERDSISEESIATEYITITPPLRTDTYPLYPDSDIVGGLHIITSHQDDTLFELARRYGLGMNEITSANPNIDPYLPGEGTPIVLPTQYMLPDAPRKGIVLNLAAMRLFYYPKPKKGEMPVVITHPVGIGRVKWRTPEGRTRVIKKRVDPYWIVPASVRAEHAAAGNPLPAAVPPGPDNPLGRFAMTLAIPGYLIHGTNKPAGIGMRVSHGCIRLYPEDIETLFKKVPVGTRVLIINQPYVAGLHDGTIHLEAHNPLEEDRRTKKGSMKHIKAVVKKAIKKNGADVISVDWEKAKRIALLGYGYPLAISYGTPEPEELLASIPVYRKP